MQGDAAAASAPRIQVESGTPAKQLTIIRAVPGQVPMSCSSRRSNLLKDSGLGADANEFILDLSSEAGRRDVED
jgi:hypothetical protein